MYRIWWGVSLVLVTIFQSTLANHLGGSEVKPDFVLIAVIYFGLSKGSFEGEIFGFFGGFLEDVFSGGPLGLNGLIKAIIGYTCGIIKKKFYPKNIVTQTIILITATLLDGLLTSLICLITSPKYQINIWVFPLETLYNTLYGILIFQLLIRFQTKLEGKNNGGKME